MAEKTPKNSSPDRESPKLKEGEDFYMNSEGMMVLTAAFLKRRGYCCDSGCTHCPYEKDSKSLPEIDG